LALALEQEINVATLILLRFQAQAAVAAWIAQFPVPTSPGEQVKK
jgi:hypothetical protein